MSRAPCTFTKSDIARALKGAREAGYAVRRVFINRKGDIELSFETTDSKVDPSVNEWDVPSAGKTRQ
jgi:hypothetical protein